jgi:hypothetical protein
MNELWCLHTTIAFKCKKQTNKWNSGKAKGAYAGSSCNATAAMLNNPCLIIIFTTVQAYVGQHSPDIVLVNAFLASASKLAVKVNLTNQKAKDDKTRL